jgi:hypothetical protein
MRLCRSWLAVGLLAVIAGPFSARAAVVYKWIDADGVVHFSDQPVPGAEKIITAGGSSHGSANQPTPDGAQAEPPKRPSRPRALEVSITSPAPGQTISGAEVLAARLSVQPEIEPDHPLSISWTLNGAPVTQAEGSVSFTLPDLPRGVYTLAATVTDPDTGESKSAEPVTFNVLRPGLLSPQHK